MLFLIVIVAGGVAGARQQRTIADVWADVRRVMEKPDVEAITRALRRETFGIYCIGVALPSSAIAVETTASEASIGLLAGPAGASCYMFDRDGVVFGAARSVVKDVIVKIETSSDSPPTLHAPFLSADEWRNLKPIIAAIANKEFAAERIILKRADGEVMVELAPGNTPAYFSLQFDPQVHLGALRELRKQLFFDKLEYLDLRVEGKIFYK